MKTTPPIPFAGSQLGEARHVCAFFNSAEDEGAVICVYDLARFGGDTVIDIMRTHPMVIIGSILQSSPFYVPPEEFLREVRQRKSSGSGSATA